MIPTRAHAVNLAVTLCVVWAVASALILLRTTARTEFALAAAEARAVAASVDASWQPTRTPVRATEAVGRIVPVVRTMQRRVGEEARRLAVEDRALVLSGGFARYVSVPIKDADQWDIVGAVVLRAQWWRGLLWGLLTIGATTLVSALLARRAMRRVADSRDVPPWRALVETSAVLSVGMAVVAVLARFQVTRAELTLPAVSAASRFDPLVLSLPNHRVQTVALMLAFAATVCVLHALAWATSSRRPAGERREALAAWAFLAPSGLHLAVFTLGPLLFTAWLSFHDWDLLATSRPFVGLANYRELAGDPLFWRALGNTALYSLYVPVTMALALAAALVLDQPLRGMRVLRAIVFLPTVISYVAIAMVWQWLYHADYGLLNYVVRSLGGTGVDWLGDPRFALLAVMIVSAWVQVGYQVIVYLAGLQGIPAGLHEAARLDGASAWSRFRHITLPLLRPVSLYLFITGIIWSFQVFALVYVMTEGGPVHATDVLVYRIYQNAWEFRRMGYASAMSWVLFAILVVLTALQWRLLNRRVEHAA
ncbi:MAG: sugar ABC transporter permease [Gemmatimonadaceae bacterium]|nr:sugar ABC transporter permease [Gemmatimonadaceae bacterium]